MKIGVISDTHGYFDPRLPALFAGVDHILHAGDIGRYDIISELENIAPVTAVLGNNDYDLTLRETEIVTLDGRKVLGATAKSLRSCEVNIVDEMGAYLMPARPKDVRYADEFPVRAARMKSADHSADSYKEYVATDQLSGEAVLATYRKVFYDPSDRTRFWLIAPSVAANTALQPASQLAKSFLIVGLAVLLGTATIAFALLVRLTMPLQRLAEAADQIANGQLDTRLPEVYPIGEVKALYHSIGSMT